MKKLPIIKNMALQVKGIDGLYIIPNVFDSRSNEFAISIIESNRGKECKQIHFADEFGWKFLPKGIKTKSDYLGEKPEWLDQIWDQVLKSLHANIKSIQTSKPIERYDHALINHYEVGDGCKSHTDDLEFWDDWVCGVSFGSGCIMNMSLNSQSHNVFLPTGSVYLLTHDARYRWKHSIQYSSSDLVYGVQIPRTKRISITFRTINSKFLSEEERNGLK